MLERDPDLLEFLEGCSQERFEGFANRVVWADRSPIQGSSGARGRWNSPDCQFEVLNTSLEPEGADAEFEAFWSLFEQRPNRRALNWKLRVRLMRVVELGYDDAGQELPRRDLALLTRALEVNASCWPEATDARYREERRRLGRDRHFQAKKEVARQFGHGVLDADLTREAPVFGATLVGVGTVRKDRAQVFDVPLPRSMSEDSVHRAMVVTLAWISPTEASRARYRLAAVIGKG